MGKIVQGRPVIPGNARGELLASDEPLSLWGGYDHRSGKITDRRHPLCGESAAGKVLALPFTRGSSTTTAVLLEALRAGTAPVAILTTGVDTFFALASIVADEMYQVNLPIITISPEDFATVRPGERVEIREDGTIFLNWGVNNAD